MILVNNTSYTVDYYGDGDPRVGITAEFYEVLDADNNKVAIVKEETTGLWEDDQPIGKWWVARDPKGAQICEPNRNRHSLFEQLGTMWFGNEGETE